MIYLASAFSVFTPLLGLFLVYLPFTVFGFLLTKRSFVKSYILGYGISFVPSILIYIISTYLKIPLNYPFIIMIFYALPLLIFFTAKKRSLEMFKVEKKESIFILIVLFFTIIVAYGIVNDTELFMSNGVREFTRLQPAIEGMQTNGLIPLYQPAMGQGGPTYLWVPPSHISNFFLVGYILNFLHPILFFNAFSFFILFLSTLGLGMLFSAILNKKEWIAITVVTLITGLNFIFLQKLESIKEFTAFPIAYLLLVIILDNPKTFKDFFILMYFSTILMTIHPAYGLETLLLALVLFLFRKLYIVRGRGEIKNFLKWINAHKVLTLFTVVFIVLTPLFYFSNSITYKEYLLDLDIREFNFQNVRQEVTGYFRSFYNDDIAILSLKYPDVRRIDDHKLGFFISVAGVISLILVNLTFKRKDTRNFFMFEGAVFLKVIILSFIVPRYSYTFGGLFRTNKYYLLILLAASILVFICLFKKKYLKLIMIAIVALAFLHSIPFAKQNINNIHREAIMSGDVYKDEIGFIKQLPIDGRIITYGLFSNAVDFGISQLTGHYLSRDEREEMKYHQRIPYNRLIHGSGSFGEAELISDKSGLELSNYFRVVGYKYLFLNICHPVGSLVAQKVFPDFSYAIYQNNCMVFLVVNNTNYVEKVAPVENVDEEIYKTKEGHKFITTLRDYGFENAKIDYAEVPIEPQPLQYTRVSPTKIIINGDFNENEWVLFKERFWLRWKAYINNKEVHIFPNNHELLLIKTIKGNSITLEYSLLKIEKIFGIISFIGVLGLAAILVIVSRSQR